VSDVEWSLVAEIFADALELAPDQRPAFIDARCAGQPDVLSAVQRMLAARDDAKPAFLASVSRELLHDVTAHPAASLERIGPWRVIREIGRGGMGQVFLAERADGQFEQQVAIKLLKRGMDSEAILARFRRERQILAALDHPNIARLLDGGIADDGRPYVVMEYVDGESITAFADARRLSVDARLTLLRTVCLAVEYAHRNLIVHRDLKPSNILVTRDGRPKLLDFGIAKLLSAPDEQAETSTLTAAGVRLLTPDYAAPEQFHGGPITTATDVYGLGAVLFELLIGRPPFGETLESGSGRARDSEPVSLSTAAVRMAATQQDATGPDEVAVLRSTDPVRLRRRLTGDLDTIVATALRTAPERRYASIGALHDDLRRHQERLPVRARPDTLGYRTSRFVRRHRLAVLAAAVIAVLLVAFGVSTTLQARALEVERDRARLEAAAAREVSEFLVGVFAVADPMTPGQGEAVRASDLLDRGATRIEADLAGQPAVQARLLGVIGRAYDNLDRHDRSEPLLARAAELQRATGGPDDLGLVTVLQQLARVRANRGDFPQAAAALDEAMSIQRRVAPGEAALGGLLVDLAYVAHGTGDSQKGQSLIGEAVALYNRLPVERLANSRADLLRMAELLGFSREWARTDSVFRRLIALESSLAGPRTTQVATALLRWAESMRRRGDLVAADSMLALAAGIHNAFDPGSLTAASVVEVQASVAMQKGDLLRADSLSRVAVRIYRSRLGEDHRQVAMARFTLGDVLLRRGLFEETIEVQRLAQATFQRDSNDAVSHLLVNRWRLGVALRAVGRLDEAISEYERALAVFEARFPPDYILTANVRRDYGDALVEAGRAADAERALRPAIDVLSGRWGKDDFRVDMARVSLGRALGALGRRDDARRVLEEALARLVKSRGAEDSVTRRARGTLSGLERPRAGTVR
jgi:serine/threonine-protein kinase